MQKQFKTVSAMLFLLAGLSGTAYASSVLIDADDVRITQQNGACTGVVKDVTGESVIGASVVVKGMKRARASTFPATPARKS